VLKNFVLYNRLYNTFPVVVHCPGVKPPHGKLWDSLVNRMNHRRRGVNSLKDATIITWNNRDKGYLEKSLDGIGVEYTVLGRHVKNWNNVYKLKLTVDALEKINTKYVIGLDSCDIIVVDDPNKLVERFKEKDCQLIFNSQCCCYPRLNIDGQPFEFVEIENKLNTGKYKNCRLNAGAFIGETEFCKTFFGSCLLIKPGIEKEWAISEQIYIKSNLHNYLNCVKLDYECELFQVIEEDQEKDILNML
jgi:hypothetical protein